MMRPPMSKPATLCLLAIVVCAACLCSAQEQPSTTLKVDVKLVNVFVTVTDARGAPVGSLTKENFTLYSTRSRLCPCRSFLQWIPA